MKKDKKYQHEKMTELNNLTKTLDMCKCKWLKPYIYEAIIKTCENDLEFKLEPYMFKSDIRLIPDIIHYLDSYYHDEYNSWLTKMKKSYTINEIFDLIMDSIDIKEIENEIELKNLDNMFNFDLPHPALI